LPSKVKIDAKEIEDPLSICEELNCHFCNIGHKMAIKFPKPLNHYQNHFSENVNQIQFT